MAQQFSRRAGEPLYYSTAHTIAFTAQCPVSWHRRKGLDDGAKPIGHRRRRHIYHRALSRFCGAIDGRRSLVYTRANCADKHPAREGKYRIEIQFANAGELSGATRATASITKRSRSGFPGLTKLNSPMVRNRDLAVELLFAFCPRLTPTRVLK